MKIDDFIKQPITGVNAFNELALDADIWTQAHEQHHRHRWMHQIAAHRPGIVYGLEVVITDPKTVVVAPGVAVDDAGQTIVLSEPSAHTFKEHGQFYLTLEFEELLDGKSKVPVSGGEKPFRLIEGRRVQLSKRLPNGAYIELARISRPPADNPIREAINPFDPGPDELNLLHRPTAFPHCYADLGIAEISFAPLQGNDYNAWKPNRAGLVHFLREANGAGFHATLLNQARLTQETPTGAVASTLLYIAGKDGFMPFSDAEIAGLSRHLGAGGTLMGEACGGSPGFAASFRELAARLGATLSPVGMGHPLLTAHHIFPGPPPGAQSEGDLLISDSVGVVLSTYDYGGAWQGLVPSDVTVARERIRQAHEFGRNVLAWAAQRQRRQELSRLR